MKNKRISITLPLILLLTLSGCNSEISNSGNSASNDPSSEKLIRLLNNLDLDNIVSYDFVDRSYSYNSYNGSKYIVTGDSSVGMINYEATHKFKLFNNDFISDQIVVNYLGAVENKIITNTVSANGQVFVKDNVIYDYFICPSMTTQSYVNCYEVDVYRTFNQYFNYLSILSDAITAFTDPNAYFPSNSGYQAPILNIATKDNVEIYSLQGRYPGDDNYKPFIIDFNIEYDTKANEFKKIIYQERSMMSTLDADYEISTSSLVQYTITNIKFGNKTTYSGALYTFDNIVDKEKIHNAPEQVVDVSKVNDGELNDKMVQNIIRNIYAYSNDVRQANYSMLYHGAFDFANTDRTEFGNALFEGKMIAYSNGILDNNGTIQLVDSDDSPKGEKSPFRIFTKAEDKGIFKGGQFSKYITSSFGFVLKSNVNSAREYLDANPLYWPELSQYVEMLQTLNLGKNYISSGSSFEISMSGNKSGNNLELKAQIHFASNNKFNIENFYSFTFTIENDKLMYCKFVTTGHTSDKEKYDDVYEARFVHAPKVAFSGEEMDILNEIDTQVDITEFEIL